MIDTKLLRQKILDLAIRGKLVPQDPTDEPASVLLEKIRAEKAELIKQGKIKKSKQESFIYKDTSDNRHYENVDGKVTDITDQIFFEVPDGWEFVRLNTLCTISGGATPSTAKRNYWGEDVLWVTSKDMKTKYILNTILKLSVEGAEQLTTLPPKTLVMVVRSGILRHSLPLAILKKAATINQDLKAFRFFIDLSEWVYCFLSASASNILANFSKDGMTVDSIKFDMFQSIIIPLPPAKEQERIASAVSTHFELISQIENEQAELSNLATLAKSKILDLAMRGKLVPQDPNDEPASELLARLSTSHKSHYEKLPNLPYEIPENWVWTRLGEICTIFNGNSINENYKLKNFTGLKDGYSFIATKDVGFDAAINYENGVKIPFASSKGYRVAHSGFPLLCIEGGSAGRKISILTRDVCFGNKLCAFESTFINGEFIYYFLQTPKFLELFCKNKNGLIGGVSINKLKDLSFFIPPKQEQLRIIETIKLFLKQLDLFH